MRVLRGCALVSEEFCAAWSKSKEREVKWGGCIISRREGGEGVIGARGVTLQGETLETLYVAG